jgi:hypothetical protein
MNDLRLRDIARARVLIEDAKFLLTECAVGEESDGGKAAPQLFDAAKACERAIARCASVGGKRDSAVVDDEGQVPS